MAREMCGGDQRPAEKAAWEATALGDTHPPPTSTPTSQRMVNVRKMMSPDGTGAPTRYRTVTSQKVTSEMR